MSFVLLSLVNFNIQQIFGNQHYNSDPRVKANYRSGLARTIRKGFVEQWCKNTYLLTKKGWDKAESIVEDIKKNHCKAQ